MGKIHSGSIESLKRVSQECSRCGACVVRCAFLQKYGKPGDLADAALRGDTDGVDPYECSLCGLCSVACHEQVDPAGLFLDMRRAVAASGELNLKPYGPVLAYEARGDSDIFSLVRLPSGGDTVFFPGCALPSSRSEIVKRVFLALSDRIPKIGIALGCCMKPSHDLGRQGFFDNHFGRVKEKLKKAGVRRVITACPNCQKIFQDYGDEFQVTTVYELMAESDFVPANTASFYAAIHDPCPQRLDSVTQDSVRALAKRCGGHINEMSGKRKWTRCCGEGGMVKFVSPELAESWTNERKQSAGGQDLVTSCAGCTNYLKDIGDVRHILDVMFDTRPPVWMVPPLTYLARLWLKLWFKRLPQLRD